MEDLSPLSGLSELAELDVAGTKVASLEPLRGLAELRALDVRDTPVRDLAPVADLPAIREAVRLDLSDARVEDLDALRSATALEVLRLGGTRVRDLAPLSALATLRALSLAGTPVTDLAPLAGLGGLTELNLSRTGVTDLAPLGGIGGLEELVLAEAPVADLAPLAGLGRLLELQLQGTRVEDVQPLAWLTQLQGLNLSRTPVRDVTALATLGNLQWIDLSGTVVSRDSAHRVAAAAPGPAGALGDQGDRAAEAAGRALEFVREEDEVRAAGRELAEVREVLGRDHAAPERRPVRRVVVLHEADAARVDAEVADAPLVQVHDRVLAGRGMGAVVAEAVGERAVVAVRPAGAEQDDLARLELSMLGLPGPDEVGADHRTLREVGRLARHGSVDQVADVDHRRRPHELVERQLLDRQAAGREVRGRVDVRAGVVVVDLDVLEEGPARPGVGVEEELRRRLPLGRRAGQVDARGDREVDHRRGPHQLGECRCHDGRCWARTSDLLLVRQAL